MPVLLAVAGPHDLLHVDVLEGQQRQVAGSNDSPPISSSPFQRPCPTRDGRSPGPSWKAQLGRQLDRAGPPGQVGQVDLGVGGQPVPGW
jgi:hypothetical protein